jgi:hypothetical protein
MGCIQETRVQDSLTLPIDKSIQEKQPKRKLASKIQKIKEVQQI